MPASPSRQPCLQSSVLPALLRTALTAFTLFHASPLFPQPATDTPSNDQRATGRNPGESGRLEGTITFEGAIPRSSVPDDAGLRRPLIQVRGTSRGLREVVLYLTRADGGAPPANPAATGNDPDRMESVDQLNHEFIPGVVAIREGAPVVFTNSDPANHNVRATASVATNQFNVFTGIDGRYEHRFAIEPGYRPIRIGCDIHPWMRGWIFVFDHPYFVVTDERGRFRISDIPPGEYQLHVVQPDLRHRERRNVLITANETQKVEIRIRGAP